MGENEEMSETNYYLKLKQGSAKYISPWKVSNIMEDLAGEYYKKYLLDELTKEITESDENMVPVIFESSFDLYQKYSKLKNFNLTDKEDIENVYYLGNMVGLQTNLKILKINSIFSVHRSIYKLLNKNGILMERNKIWEYIEPNFNNNPELNFHSFRQYLDSLLNISGNLNDNRESSTLENNISLRERCENVITKKLVEFEKIQKYKVEFEIINSIKEQAELVEYLKDDSKRSFYNKYYGAFTSIFKSFKRPIVGVLDVTSGNLKILAQEFIKEELQDYNENRFEVVDLSRNSPTAMTYIISYLTVSWMTYIFVSGLDDKKAKKQKELELQNLAVENNEELIRLEEALERLGNPQTNTVNKFSENIVRMEDYKKVRELQAINSHINTATKETLERNEFLNSNVEIMPIEPSNKELEDEGDIYE